MPNTTEQFEVRQGQILQKQTEVSRTFQALWSKVIRDWRQPGSEDRAWLMYSANYLFRTKNVRWAIDPLRLKHRLPDAPEISMEGLRDLEFVLLTHQHGDHLDLDLFRGLIEFPILWVIPAFVLNLLEPEIKIPVERLIIPQAMQRMEIHGICITPFDGLHWEHQPGTEAPRGVPAIGYLVEFKNKRWLFPGDTRTYDSRKFPSFGPVDGLFAHVWLGRGDALLEDPPLLDEFCRFIVDLLPERVILTHLDEFGRDANDFWDSRHAQKVSLWFQKNAPKIHLNSAHLGESIII